MPTNIVNILPIVSRPQEQATAMDDQHTGFQSGFKHFLLCMKITGLQHLQWTENAGTKCRQRLMQVYRIFVPGILLVNFVFSLGQFMSVSGFDAALLNSMISSIWFLQVTLFALNNVARGWRWDRFYRAWDDYAAEHKVDTCTLVRGVSIAATVSYLVWLATATGFLAISLSSPAPPSGFMLYIPQFLTIPITVVIIVAYFFFVSTWFLITAQFLTLCVSLCKLLLSIHTSIERSLDKNENFNEKLERLRQQHESVCSMIFLADDVVSVFIMVTVFSTIPLIVLTLYFVLFDSSDVMAFSYIATWWSITLSVLQLASVFIAGGAVNYTAHKPATLLYRLDLDRVTQGSVQQLTVFLNRLTSQPIGVTAFGLFVLDKPTITTFVGSILTYAIVMVQFKPGSPSYSVTCNCTGSG
ncbi:hypothetical protein DPMN_026516 [Dreissena polymorpha]|uniref:Gustatory receptor n=2 Tax=Dreissena polymorpha TaxID=45954 RepID=A0A9D4LRA1_DREPO|nr:hypothetical protein DPMN_026516 [Dreissena polymorpha]